MRKAHPASETEWATGGKEMEKANLAELKTVLHDMVTGIDDQTFDKVKPKMDRIGEAIQELERKGQSQDKQRWVVLVKQELDRYFPDSINGIPGEDYPVFVDVIKGLLSKDEHEGSKEELSLEQTSPVATSEVIDRFLAAKRSANRSEATIRSYGDTLRQFARAYPTLPTTPEEVEAYLAEHQGNGTTGENIYIVIRLLYSWASKRLGVANPMPQVERPIARAKPPQHLSISQAEALLNAIQTDREQGLIHCLFGLGLRLGEVIRLRVVDIGEDTILVHGKERDEELPLPPEIRAVLLKLVNGKSPTEPVFQGRQGLLSDSTIQLIIKNLFDRAGITGVRPSPHTLRHTKGVLATMAGLDQFSSKRLLRHASTEMTDRYNALNLGELRLKDKQYNPLLRLLNKAELGKKPDYAQG